MRTTVNIDEDVLQAAKELACFYKKTAGQMISELARKGLKLPQAKQRQTLRNGVPLLPSRGEIVTTEQIQKIRDEEGI